MFYDFCNQSKVKFIYIEQGKQKEQKNEQKNKEQNNILKEVKPI